MLACVYNPWRLADFFQTIPFTAVVGSNLAFDEFFMLSAFLASLEILKLIRDSKMNFKMVSKLYLLKFLRLAPIAYMIFLFGWGIGPYLGSGPTWFTYRRQFSECETYWWSNMLLISNLV